MPTHFAINNIKQLIINRNNTNHHIFHKNREIFSTKLPIKGTICSSDFFIANSFIFTSIDRPSILTHLKRNYLMCVPSKGLNLLLSYLFNFPFCVFINVFSNSCLRYVAGVVAFLTALHCLRFSGKIVVNWSRESVSCSHL